MVRHWDGPKKNRFYALTPKGLAVGTVAAAQDIMSVHDVIDRAFLSCGETLDEQTVRDALEEGVEARLLVRAGSDQYGPRFMDAAENEK